MKIKIYFLIVISMFLMSVNSYGQSVKGSLRIEINGFENNDGSARILVFADTEKKGFPAKTDKAMIKKIVPIKNNKAICEIDDIPYGNYAVSAHHDEDGNGKVNKNWVGIPNEGLGASNDAKGNFGPPSFDKAKIEINSPKKTIVINLVN